MTKTRFTGTHHVESAGQRHEVFVTKKNEKAKPTFAMDVMCFSQGLISLNLIFQPTGVFNMSSLIRDDDGVSNSSANDHLHDLI